MDRAEIVKMLEDVRDGKLSVADAELALKKAPFDDLGFAKVDSHRGLRQGVAEVIYGEGKTAAQIAAITKRMLDQGQKTVLITRLSSEKHEELRTEFDKLQDDKITVDYKTDARIGIVGEIPEPTGRGHIVIATGGTSDIPVAEEAAWTAIAEGNKVIRLYDVGVSGIHRTLAHLDEIMSAACVIAVAGMEGALASVMGGLVECPVIAVPTSVGYGAAFEGLAALLSMLNSCASGVSVVNIDNGFGAGYLAGIINHIGT